MEDVVVNLSELIAALEEKYNEINTVFMNCEDKEKRNEMREERDRVVTELTYYRNIASDKCGYWNVCSDHSYGCACSPTAKVSQGYDYDTYVNLRKEFFGQSV